jgi:single-strand DNA-binding protein
MASFNKVILMGNLTRDPQLRYLPSNTAVCDVGIAVNRRWRDKDGNMRDEVCYVDATAWARSAEMINQYLKKGQPILIEGRLKLDQWTGQDGQKRSKLGVVIENFKFVGGAREGGPGFAGAPGGAPYQQAEPPASEPPGGYGPAPLPPEEDMPPPPENIPF